MTMVNFTPKLVLMNSFTRTLSTGLFPIAGYLVIYIFFTFVCFIDFFFFFFFVFTATSDLGLHCLKLPFSGSPD